MIRKIKKNELDLFEKLCSEFYNSKAVLHTIPEGNFITTFNEAINNNPFLEIFILEKDEQVAGYSTISFTYSNEAGGLVIWLEEIYIRPEFQSRGLGSEFFNFIKENYNYKRLRLEVEMDNYRAVKLYEKWGFELFGYVPMIKEN